MPKERKALERFCGVVQQLRGCSIFEKLLSRGEITLNYKVRYGVLVSGEIRDLDEEPLKAFLLTARLLTQDNDGVSIRKIAAIFDARVSQRHPLWQEFNAYRSGLNQFLDKRHDELPETYRELFETFLYGHYAHLNDQKEVVYQEWLKDELSFLKRKQLFVLILSVLFSHVRDIHVTVRKFLDLSSN